jgi:predicted O-methyltransferase YrrM
VALPKAVRRLVPDRIRNHRRLRPLALRLGLVPPRSMHTEAEAALLAELAAGRRCVVEIGVYEGASAIALAEALPRDAELHLVEPFGEGPWPGLFSPANEKATRSQVERAPRRRGGPRLVWHVATSEEAARRWEGPLDLVFIDGDHEEAAVRLDWEAWSRWVEPGGVVAFHDAREGQPRGWGQAGPTAVVDELFRAHPLEGWAIAAERDTVVAVRRQWRN